MRRSAAALCATIAALAGGASARAHVDAVPPFVTAGQHATVTFVAPNDERQVRMNGFVVTVPTGMTIVDAPASDGGWPAEVQGRTARWRGCCVPPGALASFSVDLAVSEKAGTAQLEVDKRYVDGESVRWPVALTVLPGEKESGSALTVLLVAALGLLVTVGLVVLLWLRRAGSLQER